MAGGQFATTSLKPPTSQQSVYREDCTQCFRSADDPTGLDVCLTCFNGGCEIHAPLHYARTKHPLAVNIRRTRKRVKREEPPQKITKLAINAETDEDRYETQTQLRSYDDSTSNVSIEDSHVKGVVDAVLKANTFAKQAEVKAWEQEITECEHTLTLEQQPARQIASQDLGQCSSCDLKQNLWLCLECGNLACGRAQFGGVGGNSHGVAHADSTGHGLAVKLGSITPEGTADIYCYKCNEERMDGQLAEHLAHWGINLATREKTEKSLTELQIEQNLRWEFSMTTEDGKELKPVFGPGLTGLKNLGNSCYLASVLQCLYSLPAFQKRYQYGPESTPPDVSLPAEDLETQLRKLCEGLTSAVFSKPDTDVTASEDSSEIPHQKGLAPAMIKHLIGRGHEEFSTMRQQDAFELLLHLLKLITRTPHPSNEGDPVDSFRFTMEQKLQCLSCKKVRYRQDVQETISIPVPVRRITSNGENKEMFEPVSFKECLDIFTAPETVELTCSSCGSKDGFQKQSLFKTFPQTLAVNVRRFELVNWVPTKLDIPVDISDDSFHLDNYISKGLQPGEEELPEIDDTPKFTPNADAMQSLESMGFPSVRCEKALHATGNNSAEEAMNWLLSHMDDPDIDVPLSLGAKPQGQGQVSEEAMEMMSAMGIAIPQARKALKETGGDVERAVEWVFSHADDQGDFGEEMTMTEAEPAKREYGTSNLPASFRLSSIVCHKGASIHAGHYVAFIRKMIPDEKEKKWVLFNDEKVVKAVDVEEMKKFAYVYFFERE